MKRNEASLLATALPCLLLCAPASSSPIPDSILRLARTADSIVLARVEPRPDTGPPAVGNREPDPTEGVQLTVLETWKGIPVREIESFGAPREGLFVLLLREREPEPADVNRAHVEAADAEPPEAADEDEGDTEDEDEDADQDADQDADHDADQDADQYQVPARSETRVAAAPRGVLPEVLYGFPVEDEDISFLYASLDEALRDAGEGDSSAEETERRLNLLLAERPGTRRLGLAGLKAVWGDLRFEEKARLAAAFDANPSADDTFSTLLELVGDVPSAGFDEVAVATLERMLERSAPDRDVACALRHVMLRLESFAPFWLTCGVSLDRETLRAVWQAAKARIGIVGSASGHARNS